MPEDRFARTADLVAARQDERAAALAEEVRAFLLPRGDERAVDVGTGAGALALALAPLVHEVVGVDRVPELLAKARERAAGASNATFVEGDAERLPFEDYSFDLAATLRTLHHVPRPEVVLAELVRVTRPGGRLLVIDQIAPDDPLAALAVDRFERSRDPGHTRLLPEVDLRGLFEANGLVLVRDRRETERRSLDAYLDLAGCTGEQRARTAALAPEGSDAYTAELGWYLLAR
ncbi:MAG: methyltransferase domain-containing protein [Acidobacteriota bacterium]|nr:methyltransferase domain-containing protein [Acidobacteriota bacterium]